MSKQEGSVIEQIRSLREEMLAEAGDACSLYNGRMAGTCDTCQETISKHRVRKYADRLSDLLLLLDGQQKELPPIACGFPDSKCKLGFEAEADYSNHHNTLTCPYCNPKGLKFERDGQQKDEQA